MAPPGILINADSKGPLLFRPQRLHGIDRDSAASGNHGREQARDCEQNTDRKDCNWVVPADTKEKRLDGARGKPRSDEARGEANSKQKYGFLEHQPKYIAAPRAESHPNADFAGAAADRVSHEAVEADEREG